MKLFSGLFDEPECIFISGSTMTIYRHDMASSWNRRGVHKHGIAGGQMERRQFTASYKMSPRSRKTAVHKDMRNCLIAKPKNFGEMHSL